MMGKIRQAAGAVDLAADDIRETSYHARSLIDRVIDLWDDFREQGYVEISLTQLEIPIRLKLPKTT
jgi:hypothetical protein